MKTFVLSALFYHHLTSCVLAYTELAPSAYISTSCFNLVKAGHRPVIQIHLCPLGGFFLQQELHFLAV